MLLSIPLTILVGAYSLYGGCLIMMIYWRYDVNYAKNNPTITATILVTSLKHIQWDACKKPTIN
jgi:hypothetical protein